MYTYGRNLRTHNSILVLVKRILTLVETTPISVTTALIRLSEDEQIHPVLRTNIKEAQSRAAEKDGIWEMFWGKEEISNLILRTIMLNCYQSDPPRVLRSVLSLAAFEEGKLLDDRTLEEKMADDSAAWLV